jgi:hypothetical protein
MLIVGTCVFNNYFRCQGLKIESLMGAQFEDFLGTKNPLKLGMCNVVSNKLYFFL